MKGDRIGVIKVRWKLSGKSCSGKTNIRTILILNDKNKFTKVKYNKTKQRQSKNNKFINADNVDLHNIQLPKIISDYKPGYIYWTLNILKPGYPIQIYCLSS